MSRITLWIMLIIPLFLLAFLNAQVQPWLVMGIIAAISIFVLCFISTEFALYILIFSMLLGPQIIVGELGGKAALGRGVTLRLDDFLLLLIAFSWFARTTIYKELGLFIKTPLNVPMLLYSLSCAFSTGWGMMTGRVVPLTGFFFVLKYLEYFIVYFMVANYLHTRQQAKKLVFCALLTCFLVSLYGLAQIPGGQRVSAPFESSAGEPNTFGGYLMFMMAMASGLLINLEKEQSRYKALLAALLITALPAFVFTLSRSSYLALIPMCFTLLIFSEKKVIFLIILILVVLSAPVLLPTAMKQRVKFTFTQPIEAGQIKIGSTRIDTSTAARLMSWKNAFEDFIKKPLLGYGVTGYGFMDAQIPRILVETGIIGLLIFLNLWYAIFRMALKRLKESKDYFSKGLSLGYLAGFLALIFHAIGTNTFIIVRIMEPFWLFTGIVVVLPSLEKDTPHKSG